LEYSRAPTWSDRLDACSTPAEVLETARSYLGALEMREVASLPDDCKPTCLTQPSDVLDYAYVLVRSQCLRHDDDGIAGRLALFFSRAAMRAAEVASDVPR
jgi:hypothetical protein